MFVIATSGEYASLGIGKLIDRQGDLCSVEYFDAPFADCLVHEIEVSALERVTLAEQTRVYHFNNSIGAWEIGRVLDDHDTQFFVKFPNDSERWLNRDEVQVRWARPIDDPTLFLAGKINETPRFVDGRSGFVRSIMAQRGVTMGMSALGSSAVELEAHQIEVVRRILQDPVQRYLLADEVGLGKTIEAAVLIRQCVLDGEDGTLILVIVPDALVPQWRAELEDKFFLGYCLDERIHVLPFSDRDGIGPLLSRASMLVVDESHHLTGKRAGSDGKLYEDIAAAAPGIERILLLSATPALHNERGFLEMLHLLDPDAYRLDDEVGFRRRIDTRQVLAEIVAGLMPENVLYLDRTLDQLANLFADDSQLQEYVSDLRKVADGIPDEDDPDLIDAIERVRAHISEVYRLHRRILRNRRRNVMGLTPGRSGAIRVSYGCPATGQLYEAAENWRFEEAMVVAATEDDQKQADRASIFLQTIDRIQQYACSGSGPVGFLARQTHLIGDPERFAAIVSRLSGHEAFEARTNALVEALEPLIAPRQQFVIFCSDSKTADALAETLGTRLSVSVDRHKSDEDEWNAFNGDPGRTILVCDRRAEEGINLQGGRKIVVHYDLPFNPNRVEQRLGRVDRYGSGEAVRSIILDCRDNPLETAWVDYLERALRVFDRSVASLQYLIEETTRSLSVSLFCEGAEAILDLTKSSAGEEGAIQREIRNIDQQDALDALGAPLSDTLDALTDVDDDWRTLERSASAWIETNLQFNRIYGRGGSAEQAAGIVPFCYRYMTSQPHTLLPLETFYARCEAAIDRSVEARLARVVKTYSLTYRRMTALSREGKAAHTRLLRYGDPFITGMWDITQADDRGRSTAFWRFIPDHRTEGVADLFFRFEFIIEPDLEGAFAILAGANKLSRSARAAIARRGDMALPPFFQMIWLDQEFEPVRDEATLEKLNLAYRPTAAPQGGRDFNLNPTRWRNLRRLDLPQLTDWQAICLEARRQGESALRSMPEMIDGLEQARQRTGRVDHGRLGQLRARAERRMLPADEVEWALERDLATAISQGISSPTIYVDAVVACFLTGDITATAKVDGRT